MHLPIAMELFKVIKMWLDLLHQPQASKMCTGGLDAKS